VDRKRQDNSAERRAERAGAVKRRHGLGARLGRAFSGLRDHALTRIGLGPTPGPGIALRPGPALGLLAVGLILVSLLALGGAVTLALLPFVLGVAVLVALIAARRERAANERLAVLTDRFDQSLESLKDLQWEVREREARYRDLLDHQGDVILRCDAEQRLSFANDAFCRTFGLTPTRCSVKSFSSRS
jgi:PAS domain-containing protein